MGHEDSSAATRRKYVAQPQRHSLLAVSGAAESHTLQLVPLEERGDCKPGSWNGKQSLGATCNIYRWYSSRMGVSSEAEAGNRSRVEKNTENKKTRLAKKPTMPHVCLDEIRDGRANKRIQRLSLCTARKHASQHSLWPINGPHYVMWESLSNQSACLHEINSGREKRISSPDTIRLVVDSQDCIGLHVRVRPL